MLLHSPPGGTCKKKKNKQPLLGVSLYTHIYMFYMASSSLSRYILGLLADIVDEAILGDDDLVGLVEFVKAGRKFLLCERFFTRSQLQVNTYQQVVSVLFCHSLQ